MYSYQDKVFSLIDAFQELFDLAKDLDAVAQSSEDRNVSAPLFSLEEAAEKLRSSFSGSWLGYHSRVYYDGLRSVPAGANFSQEWGLQDLSFTSLGSIGSWHEYQFDQIVKHIRNEAGHPDLSNAQAAQKNANEVFDRAKSEIISVLETEISSQADTFLSKLKGDLEQLDPLSKGEVERHWSPKGPIMTRDMIAMGQGRLVPPHIDVLAEVVSIRHSFGICRAASDISRKAASHLERKSRKKIVSARVGTNVFIGHGRSFVWLALKAFIQERVGLPWDEFNRIPVAGFTNIARLSEMLDAAAIALLVMTAEDEMADGAMQARMNVVHEAGLFQGRLGFTKAIILLEEGCGEFSNVQGLGQIRFPPSNIGAAFEEIRRVLEREGLVNAAPSIQ